MLMDGIICLLLFLAGRLFLVKNSQADFDTYGHLYMAKEVREQRAGPFGAITAKIVGASAFRHPFLWHWLLGLLPFSFEKIIKYQRWLNPLLDAVFGVFIYIYSLSIGLRSEASLCIAFLYMLTPMWFSGMAMGPRLKSLTPRLFSELVGNLFFMITLCPMGLSMWYVLIMGGVLAAIIIASSKFGLQVMLFLVPLISLLAWTMIPLLALVFGFLLVFALSKGSFIGTLMEQLRHVAWYIRKHRKGETLISGRNSLSALFEKPAKRKGWIAHVGVVVKRMTYMNSFTGVMIKMPVLVLFLLFYGATIRISKEVIPLYVTAPVFAGTAVFVLINMPSLLYLGEAERYLNHVAFFIVAAAVMTFQSAGAEWITWGLILYGLLFYVVELIGVQKGLVCVNPASEADRDVISYLKALSDTSVIMCYPYHAVGIFRIMAETKHRVVFPFLLSKEYSAMFEKRFAADYPYVKLDKIDEMANELGVNLMIAAEEALASRGYGDWMPPDGWTRLEIGAPDYRIYGRAQQGSICSGTASSRVDHNEWNGEAR